MFPKRRQSTRTSVYVDSASSVVFHTDCPLTVEKSRRSQSLMRSNTLTCCRYLRTTLIRFCTVKSYLNKSDGQIDQPLQIPMQCTEFINRRSAHKNRSIINVSFLESFAVSHQLVFRNCAFCRAEACGTSTAAFFQICCQIFWRQFPLIIELFGVRSDGENWQATTNKSPLLGKPRGMQIVAVTWSNRW